MARGQYTVLLVFLCMTSVGGEVRAVLSNGPAGPGPRAPKAQGAPKQPMR